MPISTTFRGNIVTEEKSVRLTTFKNVKNFEEVKFKDPEFRIQCLREF